MRDEQVVAKFKRALFNRQHHARVNRIRRRGDDEAEQLGGVCAQSLRAAIGNVAHLRGERLDLGARGFGNIRFIPQRLGDGHHGNLAERGDVFEADHS